MSLIARRFRGIVVAIVVLGLSASAVFAANVLPQLSGVFSAGATTAQQEGSEADEDATEDADAPEADADDPATIGNHGSFVSQAAHMATPDGFRNHGAFVSCVAHIKDVPADATAFLAALTPAACGDEQTAEDADEEASDNHGSFVSQAAHMATPDGFRNHGAFVSCVAHIKDVPADATAFLAALTPAACGDEQTADGASTSTDADGPKKEKAAKVKHGHGRGHTK